MTPHTYLDRAVGPVILNTLHRVWLIHTHSGQIPKEREHFYHLGGRKRFNGPKELQEPTVNAVSQVAAWNWIPSCYAPISKLVKTPKQLPYQNIKCLLPQGIHDLFCCQSRPSEKSNLKKGGFILVHDSRVQSVMVMKSRQQELKAASWSQGIHKDATASQLSLFM